MERKKELLVRAYIVMFLFVVYALVIVLKIGNIALIEGDKWREKGGLNVKWIKVEADRGNIFDDQGNLLATSLPFFDVRIDLKVPSEKIFSEGIDELCESLSEFPGIKSKHKWKSELMNARVQKNRYYPLVKDLSYAELETIKKYPILKRGKGKAGVIVEKNFKRDKPYGKLASRTIGLDRENVSKIGIENNYDNYLKGEDTKRLMKKLPPGYWIPVYETDDLRQRKGDDIVSTINVKLQDIVHEELEAVCNEFQASKGCAILMDVETGAIKAISNLDRLTDGSNHEIFNHAIATSTEPGSTMKLASTLALLENGVGLNTQVHLHGGKRKFHDLWMRDSEMHGKNLVDLKEVFIKSSNVGIATLVNNEFNSRTGRVDFIQKLKSYGLMDKTGVDIKGEPKPLVKDPVKDKKSWYGTTIPWMAHGYELMMTPLQVLSFYNAIANDGELMSPYLVDRVIRNGKEIKDLTKEKNSRVIADIDNVKKLQYLLSSAVTEGTGSKVNSKIVNIAGKTGTTRVNYYDKESQKKKYNASFVGYFPAENPKYSLIMVVYDPQGRYYGGTVVGPGFKRIAERIVGLQYDIVNRTIAQSGLNELNDEQGKGFGPDYMNILTMMNEEVSRNTKSKWVELLPSESEVVFEKQKIKKSIIPDVVGMGLRDATYVLEEVGLIVQSTGMGKVRKQSIRAGEKNSGQKIEIYLN